MFASSIATPLAYISRFNNRAKFSFVQNDIIREFLSSLSLFLSIAYLIATTETVMTTTDDDRRRCKMSCSLGVSSCSRLWIVMARTMWHKTTAQKKIDLIFVFQVSWKCDKRNGCAVNVRWVCGEPKSQLYWVFIHIHMNDYYQRTQKFYVSIFPTMHTERERRRLRFSQSN